MPIWSASESNIVRTCLASSIPRPRSSPARAHRHHAAFLVLALLSFNHVLDAQVRIVRRGDDRLRGIRSVDVLVIDTPPVGEGCALGKPALQDAAVAALQAAGLRATVSATASSWFYTVEIEARSLAVDGTCVTSLTAELVAHVDGLPEADRGLPQNAWGSLLVGTMRLVHESALIAESRDQHAARVVEELRTRLSAIGERVRVANAK